MPRYTTSQTYTDGNTQIVALPEQNQVQGTGNQIVEYRGDGAVADRKDDEDLEEKLRRISEQVPVRISNTSGSSAGSGSGDFHQYRQMRRREQDRLSRMELDYIKRKEETEFLARREERILAAEERTAKKRARRLKKKENKRAKRPPRPPTDQPSSGQRNEEDSSNDEENPDDKQTKSNTGGGNISQDRTAVATPHVFSKSR
ncbi:PRKR-interacting protein 1 [Marchantia polymorpha subsp. ruderalis]|uniref:PRKR-interacting protein 1 n=2 Tax=Marchantia polymorpha TaxID=3197 RepID=A0A176WAR1_MARPO|nr:hypothetical protein AXG93_4295s1630 [Marchantia polymorpha subsp. ruderalis]PTQ37614.1 hypothetical protein MARPO_0056s0071 [Marchantia polymorpha]BBN14930.1 hypothetical protein Mp_6g15590 [Marchantia polymorpha subsp. ruderalis]|eukprot:PTQ37614.1 hypothetical protein MARPO_0056s0071 [Marchantia polymorpha]